MIELRGIGKRFRLYRRPLDRVLSWSGIPSRHEDFWALKDINLSVAPGRTLGIIGPNGAGKSTLLKLVTGTLVPTTGTVRVDGRIAALLELGTGFHPEFTGRQNIWINGQLLGLSPGEIVSREREIIEFSELGRFIDQPIRTYSSGMIVRLGFAIAASVDPQVLIVDEALSVGDARFSQKCIRRIRQFRESGSTILFVSHDPTAVSTLCDEAVLLDRGQIASRGTPAEVLEQYGALIAAQGEGNSEMQFSWVRGEELEAGETAPGRFGTFQALITRLDILNADGAASEIFAPGSTLVLRISVLFFSRIEEPSIGFMIRDHLGVDVFGTNTALQEIKLGTVEPGDSIDLTVKLTLALGVGDYSLTAAVHRDETHLDECYDWADRMATFQVRSTEKRRVSGRVVMTPELRFERTAASAEKVSAALDAVFADCGESLSAAPAAPSPFLGGFYPPEKTADERWFRWMGRRGIIVYRPSSNRAALAVGLPPHGKGVTFRARSVQHGLLGEMSIADPLSVVEINFPDSAIGQIALIEVEVDSVWLESTVDAPGKAPRELGLAVYAMRGLARGEKLPTWDDMMRSSCSATLTAS